MYPRQRHIKERKRRHRAVEQEKRGSKEKIGIKNMTLEERREYERKVKRDQRQKKKMQIATQKENEKDQTRDEQDSDSSMFEGTDCVTGEEEVISTRESASAILNIVKNSPVKKRTAWYLTSQASVKLDRFNDYQKVDIMILLVHSCSDEVKTLIGEKGYKYPPSLGKASVCISVVWPPHQNISKKIN